MIRWETMGLLVGHDGLLLGLRCDARGSHLYSEGLKSGGFHLFSDDAECFVLTAFQLVQSGWRQPGLPSWSSLVDDAAVKGPIDLEELIFSSSFTFRR